MDDSGANAAAFLSPSEKLRALWKKVRHIYPEVTVRAWRFDWVSFNAFCNTEALLPLPAAPATVTTFIDSCGEGGKKTATVRRHLATIASVHRAAQILNPNASSFLL